LREGFPLKNPRGLPYVLLKGRFERISSASLRTGLFAGVNSSGLFKSVQDIIKARGLISGACAGGPPIYDAGTLQTYQGRRAAGAWNGPPAAARTPKKRARRLLHDLAAVWARVSARLRPESAVEDPALKDMVEKAPLLLHSYAGATWRRKNSA